jgi:hypothetical protein
MVRRALLTIFPAVLAVLAFLHGAPVAGSAAAHASAVSSQAEAISASIARGSLSTDLPESVVSPAADDDDHRDSVVVRRVVSVVWPDTAFAGRILHASNRAGPRHRPCAAEPRAPPTA